MWRNNIQQQPFILQMCIICLHLAQRALTIKFFVGVFTGIVFMFVIYREHEPIDRPKFRHDQSKFEYEKNQLSDDVDLSKNSAWNKTWDGYVEIRFSIE